MSEVKPDHSAENSLWGERLPALQDALELLYLKDNISGRLGFAKSWPDIAPYILGADLIEADIKGTQDRTRRSLWQEQAEERRLNLLQIMESFQQNSLVGGVLQIDYVRDFIAQHGMAMAAYFYAPRILEKMTPLIPPAAREAAPAVQKPVEALVPPTPPVEPNADVKKGKLRLFGISDKA